MPIRKSQVNQDFYPNSPIILSTWENESIHKLDFDHIILSKDPGPIKITEKILVNTNRQIVSTINGLKLVSTKYAVKMRTDFSVTSNNLRPDMLLTSTMFSRKIVALNLFFRDPIKSKKLFHIGDLFHFGCTQDLINLWDIPSDPGLPPINNLQTRIFNSKHPHFQTRCSTEQFIWTSFLRKSGLDVSIAYPEQFSIRNFNISELSIANSFYLSDLNQLGIAMPERLITNGDPGSTYKQSDLDRIIQYGPRSKLAKKAFLKKHAKSVINFVKSPSRWFGY